MLDVYAAWIEGSKESDLEAIRQAMERPTSRQQPRAQRQRSTEPRHPQLPTSPQNLALIWHWNRAKQS